MESTMNGQRLERLVALCMPDGLQPSEEEKQMYWDIQLTSREQVAWDQCTDEVLVFKTRDGFEITIKLMDRFSSRFRPSYYNGYVKVPENMSHVRVYFEDIDFRYDTFFSRCDEWDDYQGPEMTFMNHDYVIGWDHNHSWDADMSKPVSKQVGKIGSGPSQVLQEARQVIANLRHLEHYSRNNA